MTFPQQLSVTRDPHIREIEITLVRTIDPDDLKGPQYVRFSIAVDDQFNRPMNNLSGDLVPHAPPAILAAFQDVMDWAWNKVQSEVIL